MRGRRIISITETTTTTRDIRRDLAQLMFVFTLKNNEHRLPVPSLLQDLKDNELGKLQADGEEQMTESNVDSNSRSDRQNPTIQTLRGVPDWEGGTSLPPPAASPGEDRRSMLMEPIVLVLSTLSDSAEQSLRI